MAAVEKARDTLASVPGVSRLLAPERPRDPWTMFAAPDRASDVRGPPQQLAVVRRAVLRGPSGAGASVSGACGAGRARGW